MKKPPEFKIYDINEGHCQITYSTKNSLNQRIFYCLQQNHKEIRLLRCTQEGEPSHEANLLPGVMPVFEKPKGESELEKLCIEWIEKKELL